MTKSLLFILISIFILETLLSYVIQRGLYDRAEPVITIEGNKVPDGKGSITIKGNPGISFEVHSNLIAGG